MGGRSRQVLKERDRSGEWRVSVGEARESKYRAWKRRSRIEKFKLKRNRERKAQEKGREELKEKKRVQIKRNELRLRRCDPLGMMLDWHMLSYSQPSSVLVLTFGKRFLFYLTHDPKFKTLIKNVTHFLNLLSVGWNSRKLVSREKLVPTSDLERDLLYPKRLKPRVLTPSYKGGIQLPTRPPHSDLLGLPALWLYHFTWLRAAGRNKPDGCVQITHLSPAPQWHPLTPIH